jgi:predicted RND superfamily exporter protein
MVDYLDRVEKWISLKKMLCAELLDSLVLGLIHVVCIIALIQRNLLDHLFCADLLI